MDVILVIDNSGSMSDEIASVERNISVNFSDILDASGIDYRLIMLSAYNGGQEISNPNDNFVCVDPPLGPSACDTRVPTDSPHTPNLFVHFDQKIGSKNAFCMLLETATRGPIAAGQGGNTAPVLENDPTLQAGWTAHLRPDAFKAFIMIGDDAIACENNEFDFVYSEPEQAAQQFAAALRAAAPDQFGQPDAERKFSWHSIVGVEPNADPLAVYEPADAIVTDECDSAVDAGETHQELSRMTGGLRYPVCNDESYDAVFTRIATEIVQGAALPCSWEIPAPADGQAFDKNQVNLAYTPGDGTAAPDLGRVDSQAACGATLAWYYDNPAQPTTVQACPAACERFTQDETGKIDLLFGCATRTPVTK